MAAHVLGAGINQVQSSLAVCSSVRIGPINATSGCMPQCTSELDVSKVRIASNPCPGTLKMPCCLCKHGPAPGRPRTGKPWSGSSGSPFMAHASITPPRGSRACRVFDHVAEPLRRFRGLQCWAGRPPAIKLGVMLSSRGSKVQAVGATTALMEQELGLSHVSALQYIYIYVLCWGQTYAHAAPTLSRGMDTV